MQLVNKKYGGVAIVKNERVSQRRRLRVIGVITGEAVEKTLVEAKGLVEITVNLFAFLLWVTAVEIAGFSDKRVEPFGGVHC